MGRRNQEFKKLEVPYYPKTRENKGQHEWIIYTIMEKTVSDYTGLSFTEIEELDLVEFYCYFRDARIYNLMQTEDGQEYLENAWRIQQTAPDRQRLREKKNGKQGTS